MDIRQTAYGIFGLVIVAAIAVAYPPVRAALTSEPPHEEQILARIAAYLPEPTSKRHAGLFMAMTVAYRPSAMSLGTFRRVMLAVWKHENAFKIGRHPRQNNNGTWDFGMGLNERYFLSDAREAGFVGVTRDDVSNPYVHIAVTCDKMRRVIERHGMERGLRMFNAGAKWDGSVAAGYYAAIIRVMTEDIVDAEELE